MPAVLVGVMVGSGGQWAQRYQVVPLASILSEGQASRVSIKIVADVTFPEVVSFSLKQQLTLIGAYEDMILPAPHVSNDSEKLDVVTEEAGSADVLEYNIIVNENGSDSRRAKPLE